MIYSVKGILTHTEPNLAVVEAGGIGYACRTTMNTVSGMKTGDEVKLLTYLHVREDAVELFGFSSGAELNAFKQLISVSGVGPKVALSILSDLSPEGFALCIASGDNKLLTRSAGVGAKLAQRIILELKDVVAKQQSFTTEEFVAATGNHTGGKNSSEAMSALLVLGFTSAQATKALGGLPQDMPVAEMIKNALRSLSGKN